MSKNRYSGVDSYAAFFVAYKARILTRSPFFTADDFEDIQQELMMAYLHAWPEYNDNKGDRRSFIKSAINNRVADIIKKQETQMRWTGIKEISFSVVAENEPELTLLDETASDEGFCGDVFAEYSHLFSEQNMDIEKALQDIPSDLKELFEQLIQMSVSEISLLLNIPKTTIYSRVQLLRKYLKSKGYSKK